jgi:hypothetical protein
MTEKNNNGKNDIFSLKKDFFSVPVPKESHIFHLKQRNIVKIGIQLFPIDGTIT